jgi:hypothetical protein
MTLWYFVRDGEEVHSQTGGLQHRHAVTVKQILTVQETTETSPLTVSVTFICYFHVWWH